jgi:NAD+ kinase
VSPRIRRIALVGHTGRAEVRRAVTRLVKTLRRRGADARVEASLADAAGLAGEPLANLSRWCQLMISLGGDGTVLVAGRSLAGRNASLLPINFGGLGFLAAAEAHETDAALAAVLAGRWPVTGRSGVEARVRRAGAPRWGARAFALNDVVVRSGSSLAAVHLQVSALGHDLGHLVADGLIAASASGSTAYALSAGGPVLAPDLRALVVTPACAHALGSRALVLGADATLAVRVLSPGPALVILDGQAPVTLMRGDEVEIRLSRQVVRVHENPARPFLHKLQSKLGWQGTERRSL